VGFEVRYLGSKSFRTRYHKFKISQETFLVYFSKDLNLIGENETIIITEGILDALSIIQLGYTVISPLTALHNLKFCLFLYSISDNIWIMYDNDITGRKATSKIMQNVSLDQEIQKSFKPLIYSGKDPNQVLLENGEDYLKQIIKSQI
jgi:DNA primase